MSTSKSFTVRLLEAAGIRPGMRVLDLGCGPGEVSRIAAALVGERGEVIGLDRDPAMVERAAATSAEFGLRQTSFSVHDLGEPLPVSGFDAVVARRVMMYLPDPVAVLRRVVGALKDGGVVAIEATDSTMVPGHVGELPLHDQALRWIWETVAKEGANVHMGMSLPAVFAQAGLTVDHLRAEAVIEGQGGFSMAQIVGVMQPRIVEHKVATKEELAVDTLQARLDAELPEDGVFVSGMAFGAWARRV